MVKKYFPSVKYLVLTDDSGKAMFGGVIQDTGQSCQKDISRFMLGLEHEINIHKKKDDIHFDIMNVWKTENGRGTFSIIF